MKQTQRKSWHIFNCSHSGNNPTPKSRFLSLEDIKMAMRILSIDGGGIRGILPGMLLVALEKKLQDISQNPAAELRITSISLPVPVPGPFCVLLTFALMRKESPSSPLRKPSISTFRMGMKFLMSASGKQSVHWVVLVMKNILQRSRRGIKNSIW
jgi:hypothetical protein